MEGLSVEAVTRDGNCLLRRLRPFFAFEPTENDVLLLIGLQVEIAKPTRKEMECMGVMSK
jgi:hypothetical protein